MAAGEAETKPLATPEAPEKNDQDAAEAPEKNDQVMFHFTNYQFTNEELKEVKEEIQSMLKTALTVQNVDGFESVDPVLKNDVEEQLKKDSDLPGFIEKMMQQVQVTYLLAHNAIKKADEADAYTGNIMLEVNARSQEKKDTGQEMFAKAAVHLLIQYYKENKNKDLDTLTVGKKSYINKKKGGLKPLEARITYVSKDADGAKRRQLEQGCMEQIVTDKTHKFAKVLRSEYDTTEKLVNEVEQLKQRLELLRTGPSGAGRLKKAIEGSFYFNGQDTSYMQSNGKFGSASKFGSGIIKTKKSFTLSLWLRPDAVVTSGNTAMFISLWGCFQFGVFNGKLTLKHAVGDSDKKKMMTVAQSDWKAEGFTPENTWHHLAVTADWKNENGEFNIYVDGKKRQVQKPHNEEGEILTEASTNDDELIVGACRKVGEKEKVQVEKLFKGHMTEICMYSQAVPNIEKGEYEQQTQGKLSIGQLWKRVRLLNPSVEKKENGLEAYFRLREVVPDKDCDLPKDALKRAERGQGTSSSTETPWDYDRWWADNREEINQLRKDIEDTSWKEDQALKDYDEMINKVQQVLKENPDAKVIERLNQENQKLQEEVHMLRSFGAGAAPDKNRYAPISDLSEPVIDASYKKTPGCCAKCCLQTEHLWLVTPPPSDAAKYPTQKWYSKCFVGAFDKSSCGLCCYGWGCCGCALDEKQRENLATFTKERGGRVFPRRYELLPHDKNKKIAARFAPKQQEMS